MCTLVAHAESCKPSNNRMKTVFSIINVTIHNPDIYSVQLSTVQFYYSFILNIIVAIPLLLAFLDPKKLFVYSILFIILLLY